MAALMMRMLAWCGQIEVDLFGGKPGMRHHVLNGVAHDGDRPAEDGPAVHVEIVHPLLQKLRRRRQAAAAGGPAQEVAARAVGAEAVAENALIGPAAGQEHRAGAVAEERVGLDVVRD